jgi:penicillin G amidase
LNIHFDTVNPARRELARLGLHVRNTNQGPLSESSLKALKILEPWLECGASSDLAMVGAELATRISTFFRFVVTPLALKYGGGETGLTRFLKDAAARIEANPKAAFSDDEAEFIDHVFSEIGSDTTAGQVRQQRSSTPILGWFDSLDGFGSLAAEQDLAQPKLGCVDGQTLHSQAGQSYTQFVPLHDPDSARTICPIGHSDRPDDPYHVSTMSSWSLEKLHPAPLSRAAVEKIASKRVVLSR